MKKVLIICGPTATGKTALAVSLGKKFDAELISADSRQVYKDLDIMTGKDLTEKVTIEKLRIDIQMGDRDYSLAPYQFHGVPIWMYDVVEANDEFSVNHYQTLARAVIADIGKSKKLPIVVGGTGLYIRSITQSIDTVSVPQNLLLRKTLYAQSVSDLQRSLISRDPTKWGSMNTSDRANPRRLVRAIEVAMWNSLHPKTQDHAPSYDVLRIGLFSPPDNLRKNIAKRVRERFSQDVVGEVTRVKKLFHDDGIPAATSLGFHVVERYINGEVNQEAAIEEWFKQEYDYAKRQLTWFRKDKSIHWFDIIQPNYQTDIETLVREWYT